MDETQSHHYDITNTINLPNNSYEMEQSNRFLAAVE
jgi:hypothetical protein